MNEEQKEEDRRAETALAFLVASYIPDESQERPIVVVTRNAPTVKVERKAKAKKKLATPADPLAPRKPDVLPDHMPAIGSYDARTFLFLVTREPTSPNGKDIMMHRDGSVARDNVIRAIAGFVGYDPMQDFGVQDHNARLLARATLRPPIPAEFKRCLVPATIEGYIAGMPNDLAKEIGNLIGRERAAVEDKLAFIKRSTDTARTEQERALDVTLARVEDERIEQIRKDLAVLVQRLPAEH